MVTLPVFDKCVEWCKALPRADSISHTPPCRDVAGTSWRHNVSLRGDANASSNKRILIETDNHPLFPAHSVGLCPEFTAVVNNTDLEDEAKWKELASLIVEKVGSDPTLPDSPPTCRLLSSRCAKGAVYGWHYGAQFTIAGLLAPFYGGDDYDGVWRKGLCFEIERLLAFKMEGMSTAERASCKEIMHLDELHVAEMLVHMVPDGHWPHLNVSEFFTGELTVEGLQLPFLRRTLFAWFGNLQGYAGHDVIGSCVAIL